ncbi:MAG: hypothetical protein ACYCZF_03355 [Anaerolineae bacterium]
MTKTLLRIAFEVVIITFLVIGAAVLFTPWLSDIQQRHAEKGIENAITSYMQAILRKDKQAALSLWDLNPPLPAGSEPLLQQRRERITDDLLALGIREYTLFTPEWWTTCCEPHVTCSARNAGGARVQVQVLDAAGQPVSYVFDVFASEQPYWGDAAGNPPRRWLLRDVYEIEKKPLFWPLVYEANARYVTSNEATP